MRRRSALVIGSVVLATVLTGCASAAGEGAAPRDTDAPTSVSDDADAAARQRAQAWLDAATLPPGSVAAPSSTGTFLSYTGWPCRPVEQLERFWTVPGWTVAETANWLMAHPTADLLTTAVGKVPDDVQIDSAAVGYIPEEGAQEGIVYTVAKTTDGVAVRAEVAALTASATCPEGENWGPPGQG